jgi:hypothetical protein
MKNDNELKREVKISKLDEEYSSSEKMQRKNSYSKITNKSRLENDVNNIQIEIDNDIFAYFQKENENELTSEQIEKLNKIKQETQLRTERYAEKSKNLNLIKNKDKNNKKLLNLNKEINNDSSRNLKINNTNNSFDNKNELDDEYTINVINPNIERIYNKVHPFLFINNEPLILITSDIYLFIFIFSITSFLSIIFYSIKEQKLIYMKIIFILVYLYYTVTYILLMILNPGIPSDKSDRDLHELKRKYYQCTLCNSIIYKENEFITYHCHYCNICVEKFDHHCNFVGKCIGKNNATIFRLWLFSIPCYILVIFMYIIV